MDASTTTSIWPVLLPALAGGLIALTGGVLGQLVSHWLASRTAERQTSFEKFEQFVEEVYQHDHWLDKLKNARAYGDGKVETASPLMKAKSIAVIYFPKMLEPLRDLDVASGKYKTWIFGAAMRRLSGDIKNINDGMNEAYDPYLAEFHKFQATASEFAATLSSR